MYRVIVANSVSSNLDDMLGMYLQDFAQVTGFIEYGTIMEYGKRASVDSQKRLKTLFKKLNRICDDLGMDYYDAAEEDDEVKNLVGTIVSIVTGKINASSNVSPLEKEYTEICRKLEDIEWDNELARRAGFQGPESRTSKLRERQAELHRQLVDMWRLNASAVSKGLALQFAAEEKLEAEYSL